MIAAIQHGRVAELGTHSELMDLEGIYYDLVTAQMIETSGEVSKGDDGLHFTTIFILLLTEPLSEFRMALKHPQRMSHRQHITSQSSHISTEPADVSPSFLLRQFSSAFSLDKQPEDDTKVTINL